LEVVGDPYDVFAPGIIRHPLRPVLRRLFVTRLRHLCRAATAVAYVTEGSLQARYPARPGAVTAVYSSVDLPAEAYVPRARTTGGTEQVTALVSVGSLEQMYKGIDTLIEAIARLTAAGMPVRLVHVGDGRFRAALEQLADRLGVADRVTCAGALPAGEAVRRQVDAAHLFVMPSRTEGLPRALIEAMARGLPAIGSQVGGIPELLPPADLVTPGDPIALATAIGRCVADPARMAEASARNLARARDFSAESLSQRRAAFYRAVREATDRRVLAGGRA
jgi:glycosyltransferase involved in cell wall biosynthesis